jgi:hypothetical protein
MVNKRDAEVFIVCLSCHFDVGLFHIIGQEVPSWRFSIIRITPLNEAEQPDVSSHPHKFLLDSRSIG